MYFLFRNAETGYPYKKWNELKFKQNENDNITNFVYYGKTRMKCNDSLVAPNKQNKERI